MMYVEDHCPGIEAVIRRGRVGELYSIGESNGWQNFNIVHLICSRLSELTGQLVEKCTYLIQFVTDCPGHN
jgi:dTDP-glucose 4,6-dehydratase